jgi:hypothetical protein
MVPASANLVTYKGTSSCHVRCNNIDRALHCYRPAVTKQSVTALSDHTADVTQKHEAPCYDQYVLSLVRQAMCKLDGSFWMRLEPFS